MKNSFIGLCVVAGLFVANNCVVALAQGVKLSTIAPAESLAEIEKRIDDALDSLVELELEQTSLAQLAEKIAEQFEMNVRLDEAGLDLVGVTPDDSVTGTLRGIPLRSALRLLLKEMDLTYSVDDGVLVFTSLESAGVNLLTKSYDVSDLIRRDEGETSGMIRFRKSPFSASNGDDLLDLIRRNILPDSWDELGGTGAMSVMRLNDQTLILTISQTQETHERIHRLIGDLKKVQGAKAAAADAEADQADAEEVKVRVYALGNSLTAEQGMELIKAALEDVSWDEALFIKPIADTLVIKQSTAVHTRIFKLLNDLGALRAPEPFQPETRPPGPLVPTSPVPVVG